MRTKIKFMTLNFHGNKYILMYLCLLEYKRAISIVPVDIKIVVCFAYKMMSSYWRFYIISGTKFNACFSGVTRMEYKCDIKSFYFINCLVFKLNIFSTWTYCNAITKNIVKQSLLSLKFYPKRLNIWRFRNWQMNYLRQTF